MKGVCPVCNAQFPIEAAVNDAQAREAVAAAFKLPAPMGDRLVRYMGLFRPAQKSLSWDRFARLLGELQEVIAAGHVKREGRTWEAPVGLWCEALDDVLAARETLTLPLKNHNYLFSVVASRAPKAAATRERMQEEAARHRADTSQSQRDPVPRQAAGFLDKEGGQRGAKALRDFLATPGGDQTDDKGD